MRGGHDDQPVGQLLRDAAARALGMEGRADRAAQAARHHAGRGDHLVPGDGLAPAAHDHRSSARTTRVAVILIALFNAAVRPVVLALAAPVSLILVGVLVLVLQVLSFIVVAQLAPGVHVDSFGTALIGSFIYAIINTILTAILGIDSGGSYYGTLVQRLMVKRSHGPLGQAGPGDHPDRRPRPSRSWPAGCAPGRSTRWPSMVRDGTHKLSRWEAILPSMTSGSQAGILHGNNDGIPAFRWYERDREHLMASSNPGRRDADRARASRTARACSRTTAPASATC